MEIADSDSADVARAKLMQGLAPWLGQANDPAPELLGQLIGLDFSASPAVQRLGGDARLLRDRALTALRLWLARLSASDGSPVVLLLDDLHWADDASLDALVTLLTSATGPLLVLLCARPGLVEQRPDWGEGLPQHQRLTLQLLDAAQSSALTHSLLRRLEPVPRELADLIKRRAEGNPFYAEELVGMLLDQGVISSGNDIASEGNGDSKAEWRFHAERLNPLRVPATLTGVLQARLDALEPAARRALQMASVIGPVFWDDALGALDPQGPAHLSALRRKALVQLRPTSAFDDTAEEAFQHHLMHQVSYDTVLKSQKREAHARAAAWLTQRVGDRGDEVLGITAEHCARAGEHAMAADWFLRASTRAADRSAYQVSLQYLDRAEEQSALQTEQTPPERRATMLRLRMNGSDGLALRERQAQAIDQLLALGEAHGELLWTAAALSAQTLLAYRTGRLAQAEAAGRRGAEVAERIEAAREAVLCHGNLAWMAIERRAFDQARQELAAAKRWATVARERMVNVDDGIYEVQVLLIEAELHTAQENDDALGVAVTQALDIARTLHSPRLTFSCNQFAAHRALRRCDRDQAADHINAAARLAAEYGLAHQTAMTHGLFFQLYLQLGQWVEAERAAAAGCAGFGGASDVVKAIKSRNQQAEAVWRGGRVAEAMAIWRETATALQSRGDETGARALRLRLAEARAASGEPAHIEAARLAVLAELPFLQDSGALDTADFAMPARLAAWRVLHSTGHPAAAGQLALLAQALAHHLKGFSDPVVRERVRNGMPWHRDVVAALAQP